jgi:hypothetical protein
MKCECPSDSFVPGSAGGSPAGAHNCRNGRILDESEREIVFLKQKFHYWGSSAGETPTLPVRRFAAKNQKACGIRRLAGNPGQLKNWQFF